MDIQFSIYGHSNNLQQLLDAGFVQVRTYRTLDEFVRVLTAPVGTINVGVIEPYISDYSVRAVCRYRTPSGVEFIGGGGSPRDLDKLELV